MPARRKNKSKKNKARLLFFVPLALVIFIILKIVLQKSLWIGGTRLVVAVNERDKSASIVVIDRNTNSVTKINVPKNTQIDLSYGLGKWQVGSVWDLGKQEGLEGELLSKSLTKSLKMPIDAWADSDFLGFWQGSLLSKTRSFVNFYQTNLSFKDKIIIYLFSLKIQPSNTYNINLAETMFFEKVRLASGEDGFIAKNNPPPSLTKLFVVNELFKQQPPKIKLVDKSDSSLSKLDIQNLTAILEALGAKVIGIEKKEYSSVNCIVNYAGNKSFSQKVSNILGCSLGKENTDVDLELVLGSEFARRF